MGSRQEGGLVARPFCFISIRLYLYRLACICVDWQWTREAVGLHLDLFCIDSHRLIRQAGPSGFISIRIDSYRFVSIRVDSRHTPPKDVAYGMICHAFNVLAQVSRLFSIPIGSHRLALTSTRNTRRLFPHV